MHYNLEAAAENVTTFTENVLTLSQTSPGFYLKKSFEYTSEIGEIARNEQFLLFPQCFLPVCITFCHFHQTSNCRLQSSNLEESQICCLGKD